MKGYKVFRPDWTCKGKQYAVGEIATQDGELKMCENGIHFCTELADCFRYYPADPDNKLAEVEALGNVLQSDKDSKCCTDKLKVIKELSIAELLEDTALCIEVVKRDTDQVWYMKGQIQEVFLAAIQQNGCALQYIPERAKTLDLCLAAVKKGGLTLAYVPKNMKTEEVCLAAVQNAGWALEYVPEVMKTPEICMAAVRKSGLALKYVPETKKTQELCLTAVQQNGLALCHVSEDLKTPALCMAAVQQHGSALEYVPETQQTPEICKAAVRQYSTAVRYVQNNKLRAQLINMCN